MNLLKKHSEQDGKMLRFSRFHYPDHLANLINHVQTISGLDAYE